MTLVRYSPSELDIVTERGKKTAQVMCFAQRTSRLLNYIYFSQGNEHKERITASNSLTFLNKQIFVYVHNQEHKKVS